LSFFMFQHDRRRLGLKGPGGIGLLALTLSMGGVAGMAGCGDDGGGNGNHDASEDTIVPADSSADPDAVADAASDDADVTLDDADAALDDADVASDDADVEIYDAAEDHVSEDTDVGPCLPVNVGLPDVPVSLQTGLPPSLSGGSLTDGNFELVSIDLYHEVTFSDLVTSADLASHGGNFGSAATLDSQWAFQMNLDLEFNLTALGSPLEYSIDWLLDAAGDGTDGNELLPELACVTGWPADDPVPTGFPYQIDVGTLQILVTMGREAQIAMIPEEYRTMAELVIEDDLPILLTFNRF